MGSHGYVVAYKVADQAKIRSLWDAQVEEDRDESGGGAYAGNATTLNGFINFHDKRLPTEHDAEDYVLEKHQKWSGPIACSFFLPTETSDRDRAAIVKSATKLRECGVKQYNLLATIVTAFTSRKSEMVGCKECGSRLAHSRLIKTMSIGRVSDSYIVLPSLPICPLCQTSLLSDTDLSRIKLAADKLKDMSKAHSECAAPKPGKQIGWCVGGWAAC